MPFDPSDIILASTRKLLDIRSGTADVDDRDSLRNQTLHAPEDLFSERIARDADGVGRKMLWKATNKGNLSGVLPGALTPQLNSLFTGSGLAAPLEEINPIDIFDQQTKVTRMGQGGIPSAESVPDEARSVQPTYLGFIDPLRTSESGNVGVDLRFAFGTYRGEDGKIYGDMRNPKTGELEKISADRLNDLTIAFPGELSKDTPHVRAMTRGQLGVVNREEVDYELPSTTRMFNPTLNMVPMFSAAQGNRPFMAGKLFSQAMALQEHEAPLVQTEAAPGVTFQNLMGTKAGAIRADMDGTVLGVTEDEIVLQGRDGKKHKIELYNNFPLNRKSYISNRPVVQLGDQVKAGQVLAASNYTTDTGDLAMGRNLRVAFMPYHGLTHEDAFVVSESAAKKLSSQHMYTEDLDLKEQGLRSGKKSYIAQFPSEFTRDQLEKIDENGVVKPGVRLQYGDPMILAFGPPKKQGEGQWQNLLRRRGRDLQNRAVTWDHHFEGIVTDALETKNGFSVATKAFVPLQEADKISGTHGDKGVVAKIVPDDKMPRDTQGRPFEVIQHPGTLPTRMNPSQLYEMQLAKVARKTGRPEIVTAFMDGSMHEYVMKRLKEEGLSDFENVFDPEENTDIKDVLTGEKYFMKAHHVAESKWSARDKGGYTSEGIPTGSGREGSKTLASLGLNALISHGATEFIRDSKLYRGAKNDDFWRAFRLGYTPPAPEVPTIHKKFMAHLAGAGVNVRREGEKMRLSAMTDEDISSLSKGPVESSQTLQARDLSPTKGGLFDRAKTGGIDGKFFTHINLTEPMPNPLFEEPMRRLLGVKGQEFRDILAGRKQINGMSGGKGIKEALSKLNIDREIQRANEEIRNSKGSSRDDAIKRLRYLKSAKEQGVHPRDWVLNKALVIPPMFRPISTTASGSQISADANYLYQDLMQYNDLLGEVKGALGDEEAADTRLKVYDSFKAVTGIGDPISPKLQEKRVGGLLKHVFGKGSPKCYDDATEIRTINGWVPFPEYDGGVPVATLNPETDAFEWQIPTDVIHEPYKGNMVHTCTRSGKLDLLVTPNHEHWVSPRKGRGENSRWEPYQKTRADELVGECRRVRYKTAASKWRGTVPDIKIDGIVPNLEAFAEFCGWFVSEGWLHSDRCAVYVGQSIKSVDSCERIDSVFETMGLPYTRREYTRGDHLKWHPGSTWVAWGINSKELVSWVTEHLGERSYDKKLSREVLEWDTPYLTRLYLGYMHGDGEQPTHDRKKDPSQSVTYHNRKTLTNDRLRFTTTSERLFDDMQELLTKIGMRAIKKEVPQPVEHHRMQYRGTVLGWDFATAEYPEQTQLVQYDGCVHCVTVPNGIVLVRRRGMTCFSGNSGMYQRRVVGMSTDLAGRAVIRPNSDFDMDTIGLPEKQAWEVYKPFVIRRLTREGMPAMQALEKIEEHAPIAKDALMKEMEARPVVATRAPALHKFSILGFNPKLVSGDAVHLNPFVEAGMTADYDGNCCEYNTEISIRLSLGTLRKTPAGRAALEDLIDRMDAAGYPFVGRLRKDDSGYRVLRIRIGEFPRIGKARRDKNGAFVYRVPDGFEIVTYDHEKGEVRYSPIRAYTEEFQVRSVRVTTARHRSVVVSDNESLCVYDNQSGVLKKQEPSGSVGMLVPYVRKEPVTGSVLGSEAESYKLGWFFGALISDGWISGGRMVGYAKCEKAKRDRVEAIARELDPGLSLKDYKGTKGKNKYADSHKIHMNSKTLVAVLPELATSGSGRQSTRKRIPEILFSTASREVLLGLLTGLLDGDGTVSLNNSAKSPRPVFKYATSSPGLAKDVRHLGRLLGVRSSLTENKARGKSGKSYAVCFSVPDMLKLLPELEFVGEREQNAKEQIEQLYAGCRVKDDMDIVPVPIKVAEQVAAQVVKSDPSLYTKLRAICAGRTRSISRNLAKRAMQYTDDAEFAQLVSNEDVHWDTIKEVKPVGKKDVYDFEIPDTKVFMLANDLIIYDTVSYHVPVSDAAIKEIREKMMPSANLRHPRDFDVHMKPVQGFLYGLIRATKGEKSGKVHKYATSKDAIAAYRRGEIDVDDEVVILDTP